MHRYRMTDVLSSFVKISIAALGIFSVVAYDFAEAGRLKRSGGGTSAHARFERGAGGGEFRRRSDRQPSRDFRSRSFEGGVSRAERGSGREEIRRDRSDRRGETRSDRQSERTDRTEIRQGERSERVDTRQRERSRRVEDRTELRRDIADDIKRGDYWRHHHDYYHHHHNWWNDGDEAWAFFWGLTLGATIASLPTRYETVYIANTTYYYSNGVYYTRAGNKYVVVSAPVGATVVHAPTNITMVNAGGAEYGYSNGTYYSAEVGSDGEAQFEVITPPIGAVVQELPEGAQVKKINGKTFFIYGGAFYQPFYSGSEVVYMVVKDPDG